MLKVAERSMALIRVEGIFIVGIVKFYLMVNLHFKFHTAIVGKFDLCLSGCGAASVAAHQTWL
jgi:hypothetical protein